MLVFRGSIPPPPKKRALFLLRNLRMGVAAAPYGKKLGQMLADDEVAENPWVYFLVKMTRPPKKIHFWGEIVGWKKQTKKNMNFCGGWRKRGSF